MCPIPPFLELFSPFVALLVRMNFIVWNPFGSVFKPILSECFVKLVVLVHRSCTCQNGHNPYRMICAFVAKRNVSYLCAILASLGLRDSGFCSDFTQLSGQNIGCWGLWTQVLNWSQLSPNFASSILSWNVIICGQISPETITRIHCKY